MKKSIIVLGIAATFIYVSCQQVQVQNQVQNFDCGLFSLEYPSSFHSIPIQNSPHMVLKLENDSCIFSASYWEAQIPRHISAWDDGLIEEYKDFFANDGILAEMTKETIQTMGGPRRCLKIKTNMTEGTQGMSLDLKMVSYLVIDKGYLYLFAFISPGKYIKGSETNYPDKIMMGLNFKSPDILDFDFDEYMLEAVKKLNAQCPIKVDTCTTHLNFFLAGNTIMIKTLIDDSFDKLVDYDEFKRKVCENYYLSLDELFVEFLDEKGYSIVYMIYNENDRFKKKIKITCKDIMNSKPKPKSNERKNYKEV